MSRRRLIPAISVAVALGAIAVAVAVTVQRQRTRVLSDKISEPMEGPLPGQHELVPNLDGARMVVPDRPHSADEMGGPGRLTDVGRRRSFDVSTNSRGLRGPEIEVPATRYRILCVGDSVTFGWGCEYEESWPARLSEELGVDAVNAAWPGAHPDRMGRWIRENARALDADLVLFCWGPWKDGEEVERLLLMLQDTAREIAPIEMGWVLPPPGTFDPIGSRMAREVYPTLAARIPSMPVFDVTPAFRAALPLPGVIGEHEDGVQRMIRLPDREVLVEAPAPEHGIAPEILAKFEEDPSIKEPLFFDEGHPDAEGFVLFAREVAAWVRANGWVE